MIQSTTIDELVKIIHNYSSDDISFAFLSGSVVEGISTRFSDYDVYVVKESCDSEEIFHHSDELGLVELNFINYKIFRDMLAHVAKATPGDMIVQSYDKVTALHKVLVGCPLINRSLFLEWRNKVSFCQLHLFLAELNRVDLECFYMAGLIQLKAEEFDSAISNLYLALDFAFDMVVALRGNTSPKKKWRIKYAEKYLTKEDPFYNQYFVLLARGFSRGNKDGIYKYIQAIGLFIQAACDLYAKEMLCRYMDITSINQSPPAHGREVRKLKKTPFARLSYKSQKFYILNLITMVEISNLHAFVWVNINEGSTEADILIKLSTYGDAKEIANIIDDFFSVNALSYE